MTGCRSRFSVLASRFVFRFVLGSEFGGTEPELEHELRREN
jgi:hypothetical protein